MLMGNCSDEKMVVISSATSEWPQNNLPTDDPKSLNNNNNNNNMASSTARIMEKPGQDQLQQQQQALKCPRCDSSNTKFCYYNNYSLSQPRHFCKACKRYWTRGGTLRNVPVGGGCRKNKRVKRPNSSSSVADHHHHNNNLGASNNSSSSSSPNSSLLHGAIPSSLSSSALQPGQIDLSTAPNHHLSPLFYGLANNINSTIPSDISLPFSSRFGSTASGFDLLQPQLNSLGLGFSSGNNSTILSSTTDHHNNYNQNGFSSNSSLLSSYSSIFSSPSSASASPTIASLLASKFTNGGGTAGLKDHTFVLSARGSNHNFPSLLSSPFEELQITGNNGEPGTAGLMKHVKLEEDGQRRLDWDGGVHNCSVQNDHQTAEQNIGLSSSSSDPSNSLNYWSNQTAVVGANWLDPGNIGSSVPSLI